MRKWMTMLACASVIGSYATSARATYHTFRINEIYSNASGSVQFIELKEAFGFNSQNFVSQAPDIKSGTNDFVFATNLPSSATANKTFLLGTAGYASLTGAPAPDYIIPANFFNPAGDTLQYGTTGPDLTVDLTTFGAQPANTLQSLNRVGTSGNTYTAATNSPTNFSGATSAIPEPTTGLLVASGAVMLMWRRKGR